MFNPIRIRSPRVSAKTVILTGGLNESVSNLEMKAGELTGCLNYEELEGLTHGYTSTAGYERYDGQALASTIDVVVDGDGKVTDDTAREAQRALILAVPGAGPIRGVHVYKGVLYAIRNGVGETDCNLYKETASGWAVVQNFASPITIDQVSFINFRFSLYLSNIEVMVWVDGANDIKTYNGTAVASVATPGADVPYLVGAWKNRLFVAMPEGHMYFSAVGDPTDFSTATITGEIFIGEDITTIKEAPGGVLVVASQNSIQTIYYEGNATDFIFRKEEFSGKSGMILGTVERMLGTLYFADDRGVTTMEASDVYGDFSANTLAKKVQNLYQTNKENIITSSIDRNKNQYQLFFESGDDTLGLVFTFADKRLRGTTLIKYPLNLTTITGGKDSSNNDISYFGDSDGFVYKKNSGTSFDGEAILTRLATSFHSYGTTTRWKDFKNLLLELSATRGLDVSYRMEFDYAMASMPKGESTTITTSGIAGIFGEALWSLFSWGSGYLTQLSSRVVGYGSNMRLLLTTESKYEETHTFHNFVAEYVIGARKM